MHKAVIKKKSGNHFRYEEIFFSYARHSDAMNITAFSIGDSGTETLYVKDENIVEITKDPATKSIYD